MLYELLFAEVSDFKAALLRIEYWISPIHKWNGQTEQGELLVSFNVSFPNHFTNNPHTAS